jgi:hypothetical protein
MRCACLQMQVIFLGNYLNSGSKEAAESHRHDQEHELWAFLSGSFNATQRCWSIIEKEAFPIMDSLDKLRHFLLSQNHFRLFTDHQNLIFLLGPTFKKSDSKKQTVDKLCRWASKLQGFRYIIEHPPGEANLWAHVLSRWVPNPSKARTMALRPPIAPLLERDFSWR